MGDKNNKYTQSMPIIQDDLFGIGHTSDFSKALEKMFTDDETLKLKTDLTPKQICKLNIIKQMANYYNVPLLKEMYYRFIALRVSKERKGRKEAVDMTQQIISLKRLEGIEKMVKEGVTK